MARLLSSSCTRSLLEFYETEKHKRCSNRYQIILIYCFVTKKSFTRKRTNPLNLHSLDVWSSPHLPGLRSGRGQSVPQVSRFPSSTAQITLKTRGGAQTPGETRRRTFPASVSEQCGPPDLRWLKHRLLKDESARRWSGRAVLAGAFGADSKWVTSQREAACYFSDQSRSGAEQ